jgi:hypothetical protein
MENGIDQEDSARASDAPESTEGKQEEAMLFCPVCNARLLSRRCKLICERCGYYMSCADYY